MRPDQTLPPASSLAVLAAFPLALLFGCADGELEPVSGCVEGELEPSCEAALVDALVEEVETGLWAGEGNPLAYGDEDDGFRCDEMDDDCFKKCFDGPSDTCTCEEDLENEDWCCCFGEPGCDMCTGGGGGCGGGEGEGTGGGEGEEDEDEEEDEGEGIWGGGALRLDCFESRRGERGGCEVRTALDMDSLRFEWLFGGYGGEGEFYSRWRGTATETRKIGVSVTMLAHDNRVRILTGEAVVRSRPWQLNKRGAKLEYVDEIPGVPNVGEWSAWGRYDEGHLSETLTLSQGSGPWEGSYYVSSLPQWGGKAKMYAHKDLKSGGPEYLIPDTVVYCGLSGVSRGVYALNAKCSEGGWHKDWKRNLDAFRDSTVAHERRHQESLNECIETLNLSGRWGRLGAVEEIAGNYDQAYNAAKALWTNGVYAALINAKTTAQEGHSTNFAHWRTLERWAHGGKTGDHKGTEGCP